MNTSYGKIKGQFNENGHINSSYDNVVTTYFIRKLGDFKMDGNTIFYANIFLFVSCRQRTDTQVVACALTSTLRKPDHITLTC